MKKPDPSLFLDLLPGDDPDVRRLPAQVKIYCVGGAVRDRLLGDPVSDRDYVVVGARIEDMHQAGFTPVGKDFPVFLHPKTHDEYALARTERKSGKGYKGFVFSADPDVTLEQDLSRRDLTINAMAVGASGELSDPFGGLRDLSSRMLRHVGPAFSEDPVRLLRLARFSARWPDMTIAQETMSLCQAISAAGETQALVAERIWQELSTGLMERQPSKMFEVLVLAQAWPAVSRSKPLATATLRVLDHAAACNACLDVRFALFADNSGAALDLSVLRLPATALALSGLLRFSREKLSGIKACLEASEKNNAELLLEWLTRCDAARRPERMQHLLLCHALSGELSEREILRLNTIMDCMSSPKANKQIADAAASAARAGLDLGQSVREVRLSLLRECLLAA